MSLNLEIRLETVWLVNYMNINQEQCNTGASEVKYFKSSQNLKN